MNRRELIERVSDDTGYSLSTCEKIYEAIVGEIQFSVSEHESIFLRGFLSIDIKNMPERKGRNPVDGKVKVYPSRYRAKCRLSESIKDLA